MNFVRNPTALKTNLVRSELGVVQSPFELSQMPNLRIAPIYSKGMNQAELQIRKHYSSGNVEEGLSLAKKLAKTNRNDDTYLALIAAGYMNLKRPIEAAKWAQRALKINKMSIIGHEILSLAYHMTDRFQESNRHCRIVLGRDPQNMRIKFTEAHNFQKLHDYDTAIKLYQDCLAFQPNNADVMHNLMLAANTIGNKDLVKQLAKRLIEIDDSRFSGYYQLASVTKFSVDDPESISLLQQLVDKFEEWDDLEGKSKIASAIARAAESLKQYDLAFNFYNAAAAAKTELDQYNYSSNAALDRKTYSLLEHWTGDPSVNNKQTVTPKRYPILIVGMPRSGTSLTEQILASHSQVYGGGELPDLRAAFEASASIRMLKEAEAESLKELAYKTARSYMKATNKRFGKDHHIVDKLPNNYVWSAMILAAIPNARVIFTRRDPMATVWSAFKSNFSAFGMGHTRNLYHLVDYYEQSLKFLVRHKELFGDRVYVMNYEKLTEDQENQTRLLLDYCGLDFEEACLEFYKNKRGIDTASAQQVVQPMYKGSSQAWRKFEKQLLPYAQLLDELDRKYGIDSL